MSVGGEEQDDKNRTGAVQEEGRLFLRLLLTYNNQSLALLLHPAPQRSTGFRKPHSLILSREGLILTLSILLGPQGWIS